MKFHKKITIEFTSEEKHTLLQTRDLIDTLIDEMGKYNLKILDTDYYAYSKAKLDEIATDLYNLTTICGGY